jgi:phosphoglycolate phosphatase
VPGIREVLAALSTGGWVMGVATGMSDRGLLHCLEVNAINSLFATLQTADRHPSKPHPSMAEAALSETGIEPAHAVMIGDTVFDMEMAANSGMRALGVDWGYHPAEELMAAGAEMVASEPRHITEHLLS